MSNPDRFTATPDMPTLLLVNPGARLGKRLFPVYRKQLASSVNLVDAALTQSREEMVERIRAALSQGIRRIIVGGGDGTLSGAANVLVDTHAILGVLPLGTGNTFSYGLNLPVSPQALVDLLARGPVGRYDVGLAATTESSAIFLNSLTLGFSARLVELLTREAKDRMGHWAWVAEFRKALANTPPLTVSLTWPTGQDRFQTRQLVVVNGRTIVARISATPRSSAQDGLLEVFRLGDPTLISIVRVGTKLLTGRLLDDADARYQSVTEVTVDASPPLSVSIDGEVWRTPPITCRVLPSALAVIAPQEIVSSRHWPMIPASLGAIRPIGPFNRKYTAEPGGKKRSRVTQPKR